MSMQPKLPIAAMTRQEIRAIWERSATVTDVNANVVGKLSPHTQKSENHLTGDDSESERAVRIFERFHGNTGSQIAIDAINQLRSSTTQAAVGACTSGFIFGVGTLVTIMSIPSLKHMVVAAATTLTLTGCAAGYGIIKRQGANAAHDILDMLASFEPDTRSPSRVGPTGSTTAKVHDLATRKGSRAAD